MHACFDKARAHAKPACWLLALRTKAGDRSSDEERALAVAAAGRQRGTPGQHNGVEQLRPARAEPVGQQAGAGRADGRPEDAGADKDGLVVVLQAGLDGR